MTPGDALAFATRFDLQWAYRGSQALFWQSAFERAQCTDLYLPLHLRRPFQRRGLVQVHVECAQRAFTITLTQFSPERDVRAIEMQFVRTSLRNDAAPHGLFFAACSDESFALHAHGWLAAPGSSSGTFLSLHGAAAEAPLDLEIGLPATAWRVLLKP